MCCDPQADVCGTHPTSIGILNRAHSLNFASLGFINPLLGNKIKVFDNATLPRLVAAEACISTEISTR